MVLLYMNHKGTDHASLTSAYDIRCVESVVVELAAHANYSVFVLVSLAEQAGLSLTWS